MVRLSPTLPQAFALIRLSERRLLELFGVRAARVYAIGVALSFAIFVLLVDGRERQDVQDLTFRALSTLSWVVTALAGLSAARDLAASDAADGVTALVRQRGFNERTLEQSRVIAVAVRVARLIALPGLLVAGVALLRAHSFAALPWLAYLCVVPLAYGPLLGAGVALLARGSAKLLPRHGRAVFALLALGPELLRLSAWDVPSLPALYGFVLRELAALGERLP